MNIQQKKKNYYRLALQGGKLRGFTLTGEYRLQGNGSGNFSYLAPVFDAGEYGETFHRFCLEGNLTEGQCEITVMATDADLSDEGLEQMGEAELLQLMEQYPHVHKLNTKDFLLHELQGRYLWIYVKAVSYEMDASIRIDGFSVEFPRNSFANYLPEIYRETEDGFFERYMAALGSLYEDLEAEVDRIPALLDYESTEDDKLLEMAEWVGLKEESRFLQPEHLRFLLQRLQKIQSGKGTREVLEEILSLFTGKKPYIVEYYRWHDWMEDGTMAEDFSLLYGKDHTMFSCLLDYVEERTEEIPSSETLMKLIRRYVPFGLTCNLVFLVRNHHLDTHCYLDVNSYLSTPAKADTTGFMLGGNYVLG